MAKTIDDLKAIGESLMKRRTQVALAIADDLDDDVIGKLAMIDAAIVALDKEIGAERFQNILMGDRLIAPETGCPAQDPKPVNDPTLCAMSPL
jgi:hypothetical protein